MTSVIKALVLGLFMSICQNLAYALGGTKSHLFLECVLLSGAIAAFLVGILGMNQRAALLSFRNTVEENKRKAFNEIDYMKGAVASISSSGLSGCLIGYVSYMAGDYRSQGMYSESNFFLIFSFVAIGGCSILYIIDDSDMRHQIRKCRLQLLKRERKEKNIQI